MPEQAQRIEAIGSRLRALLESVDDPAEGVAALGEALTQLSKSSPGHPVIRELVASQEARASDELQRAVLHDVKNMLNLVALNLELTRPKLARTLGASDGFNLRSARAQTILSLLQALDDAQILSEQACRLSLSTLDLCQSGPGQLADLGAVLELCARSSERVLSGKIELKLEVEAVSMVAVQTDRAQLFRVLLNLLKNAEEAQTVAGQVCLRAWKTDELAFVEVEDDGPGLNADPPEDAFDMFYTTKSDGGGLGLFTVKRLVEGWGGQVQLASQPGRTRLTFSMPRL